MVSVTMADALVWALQAGQRTGKRPALYTGSNRPYKRQTIQSLINRGLAEGDVLVTIGEVPLTPAGIAEAERLLAENPGRY